MTTPIKKFLRVGISVVVCLGLVGMSLAAVPYVKAWLKPDDATPDSTAKPDSAKLVPGLSDGLEIPADVAKKLGVRTAEVRLAPPAEPLQLSGTLFLDPSRLARVHSPFTGRVASIAETDGAPDDPSGASAPVRRPVRFGDHVRKNQLLAVVWSRELGEKKSELVDCLSRERLDRETRDRLRELSRDGSGSERSLREADRTLEADRIAVERAENTLRSWGLKDADIAEIRATDEALKRRREQTGTADDPASREMLRNWADRWATVEIRAPAGFDGVILEMNFTVGDAVDPTIDLFKIADLSKLRVLTHAYEEDLPSLRRLPPDRRRWSVRLKSEPDGEPLETGGFDLIGPIVDPVQHTATVMGWVANPADAAGQYRLRVGQFVTAAVPQPTPDDQVVVPRNALLEEGRDCSVLVQLRPGEACYARRPVAVVRRGRDVVYVKSVLTADERGRGLQTLRAGSANEPGDRVVVAAALELAAALDDLKAAAPAKP